jgi:hypothetical protein
MHEDTNIEPDQRPAYAAVVLNAHDHQQRLAVQRAAAVALSDHINPRCSKRRSWMSDWGRL